MTTCLLNLIDKLVSKLKLKLGFFFRNKSCLDYGDLLFMNAPDQYIKKLDTVYHCALRF